MGNRISSLFIVCVFTFIFVNTVSAQSCGNSTPSNIVIMLDLTGSMTANNIAQEKAAATSLIQQFSNNTVKPLISIGTFNTNCFSYSSCYPVGGINEARITTSLSNNYSAALTALSSSGSVQGSGPGGDGIGGTNLSEALNVARAEIEAHSNPNFNKVIVLISDGNPNFPGYFKCPLFFDGQNFIFDSICNNQWCTNDLCLPAQTPAVATANTVKGLGIKIMTAFINSDPAANPDFLRNQIASTQADHIPNFTNLGAVFTNLTQVVSCTPTPTAVPSNTPTKTPTPVNSPTSTPIVTPSKTPTVVPTSTIVAQCLHTDTTGYKSSIKTTAKSQNAQLNRLIKELKLRTASCGSIRSVKSFIKSASKQGPAAAKVLTTQSVNIQTTILSCPSSFACQSAAINFDVVTFSKNSSQLRSFAAKGAKLVYDCKNKRGGRCNGNLQLCRERARLRRQQYQDDVNLAKALHLQNLDTAGALPKTTDTCQ